MKQVTAKTVEQVLNWIETTPHHQGYWEGEHGKETHFTLQGHFDRLRIPVDVHKKARGLMTPGGEFDRRMFRATKSGKDRLRRARKAS